MVLGSRNGTKKSRNKHELDCFVDKDQIPVNCSVLSEDGSLLVTGREDGSVLLWSARTEALEQIGSFKGHAGYISCVAVQDTFVVTGSEDGTLRKWDINDDDGDPCVFVYQGHTGKINNILVADEYIVSCSSDKTARVWLFDVGDLPYANPDKAIIRIFEEHGGPIYSQLFLPAPDEPFEDEDDGFSSASPFMEQFQTNSLAALGKKTGADSEVWGDTLITGCADGIARAWSIDTGACVKQYRGHTGSITCLAINYERDTVFTGSADKTIRSWNLMKGTNLKVITGHDGPILGLLADKRLIYSASCDLTARSWAAEFGDCTRLFRGHKRSVTTILLQQGILFSGSGDGIIRAFEAKSGTMLREFKGHTGAITSVIFVDGKVISTSVDGTVRMWDASGVGSIAKGGTNSQDILNRQQRNLDILEKRLEKVLLSGPR